LPQPPEVEKSHDSLSASRRSEQLSPRDARFPRKPDREQTSRRALARVIAAEHTQDPSEPTPERRIYASVDPPAESLGCASPERGASFAARGRAPGH